jgi:DNA-directed RNA polymerase specialized sigma24 family protein
MLRDAFRELHGRRLHGFALLLTLGDRPTAARLASEALASGAARVDELRHPERAAAWLRRRVVDRARLRRGERADTGTLLALGADEATVAALAALGRIERAALIASTVERLDRRDVGTIVGRDGPRLDRLIRRARERFMRLHAAAASDEPPDGPVSAHVQALARRAMS